MTTPKKIADYFILPLSLPTLPAIGTQAVHYLYLRPHEPKIPTPTTPRSLFLVNIPFDTTEAHIRHLCSKQLGLPSGRIEGVQFEGTRKLPSPKTNDAQAGLAPTVQAQNARRSMKRKRGAEEARLDQLDELRLPETWDRPIWHSGSNAVVVFVDRTSMEAVVKAVRRVVRGGGEVVWGDEMQGKVPAFGSQRAQRFRLRSISITNFRQGYLNHQKMRFPDKVSLLETVNNYMTVYANQETARTHKLARQRQEPDEEGFVTVTRGGRTGPARQEEAKELYEKQKERQKGFEDFYRFQSREKRKERAGELIRKFELDREKVRKMRERRGRFK
ncbi:Ribosomal RNA-processing protein 7, partial [Xylographa trunciseda]|nr:Ribosomal RNA-processing protein 7 [Xylographa trunciseda]